MPVLTSSPSPSEYLGWGNPGEATGELSVTFGDVNLGAVDDDRVEWTLTNIKGWFEPAGTIGEVEQRAADHGGWASPAYLAPRLVEIEGNIGGPWEAVSLALSRLVASVPLSGLSPLTVVDMGGAASRAMVRQGGDVLFERHVQSTDFSLSLIAPDPRRYSLDVVTASTGLPQTSGGLALPLTLPLSVNATVTAGTLTAVNEGNMPTRPTFKVYGPVSPFTITHVGTGQMIRLHESVGVGRVLTIDTDRRRALLDGTASRVVTGTWFDYAPGVNEVAFGATAYNSDSLLVSEHRSAWR